MPRYLFWLVLISFCLNHVGWGQQKTVYTLEKSIQLALNNNHKIKIAEKKIDSVKGKRLQVFSFDQPELTFGWEGIPSGKSLSQANTRSISINQNVEFPSKLFLKRNIATKELEISYEELNRVKALVSAEVKQAYYLVNLKRHLVETLEFTLDLLKQFQEATLVKYQSGQLPYIEVIRAKVEIAKIQNEIFEAQKELVSAKNDFNLILGQKGSEDLELAEELRYVPYSKTKEETISEYINRNRTWKIAQLSREKESKNLKLARLAFVPDLNLSGGYISDSGEKFIPSFEAGLSLPLWWWNPKGQIQENKANLRMAQIMEQRALRVVQSQVEKAYQIVKTSEEQVLLFEKTLLKEVDEELKAGISGYQYNQIDALSLLEIYRTIRTTHIEYYKILFNYLSALADLEVSGEETE